MRIAILEDASVEQEQLVQSVAAIMAEDLPDLSCEISTYTTMQAYEAAGDAYDLLILDLHLPDGNGLDLARRLRQQRADTGIMIITAYQEHVYEGYEVGAFRFLPKPVEPQRLKTASLQFIAQYRSMRFLLVPTQTEQLVLALDEIVCIESQGKHTVVYMQDGRNIESKKSIQDYTREIENGSFVRVHRCYLVNMKHILRLKDSKIVFDTDSCHAEISRRNRNDFNTRFTAFLKSL